MMMVVQRKISFYLHYKIAYIYTAVQTDESATDNTQSPKGSIDEDGIYIIQ